MNNLIRLDKEKRMVDRLAEKLQAKQFYDYEQLVKTLFFK